MVAKTEFYNGNPNLKRAGVVMPYTTEQVQELVKCADDPVYFIKNFVYIVSLDHGIVKFDLYDFQKEFVNKIHTNRFFIGMLARQMGKSTTSVAYLLWLVIFRPYTRVGILANKLITAREILSRLKTMYENLPDWMQHGVIEWNKSSFEIDNGSTCFCAATSSDSIRGQSVNCILLDEFAFVKGAGEFYTSTYPVIVSGTDTKVIITSTPNGINNLFHTLWTGSVRKTNEFTNFIATWEDHPHRDSEWAEQARKNSESDDMFKQEHLCSFIGSSGAVVAGETLTGLADKLSSVKPFVLNDKFNILETKQPGRVYVMTVDTSEGVGADNSTITIFDATEYAVSATPTCRTVLTFADKTIQLSEFAETVIKIGNVYDAILVIENNSIGRMIAETASKFGYENLVYSRSDKGVVVFGGKGVIPGVRTTKPVKTSGVKLMKVALESAKLIVHDKRTVNELFDFVDLGGNKYGAKTGEHATDDLVANLWMFCWFMSTDYAKSLVVDEYEYLVSLGEIPDTVEIFDADQHFEDSLNDCEDFNVYNNTDKPAGTTMPADFFSDYE